MPSYIHETRFHVRYAETDRMGVVHHANYVIYCEEARNQFSRDMGASYADFEKEGMFMVVSEVNLRYLAPAFFGQEILIQTWLEEIRSRRITFGYKIMNPATDVVHATAEVKLICTNLEGVVQRIPQSWIEAWSKVIDSES